ncbi:MAG: hypothetical protein AABP62_26855 [Planctomycetota bacterium]
MAINSVKGNTMKADFKTGAVWLVIGAALVWIARPGDWVRPVTAQTGVPATVVEWEYNSQSVDAASIQTKLTELGTAGWEVFSVASTDGVVDNAGDGKPHVVTQRFEVSAKRPKKR